MTSEPAVKRFDQHSVLGIGASISAAVAAGLLCTLVGAPAEVTGPVVAGAGGLPAAIEYSLRGRRRNVIDDISRIRQGELRRPVGLVVVMLAAAMLLVEMTGFVTPLPAGMTVERAVTLSGLICAALAFFISSYASHYLGKHPYRWTAVAVSAAYLVGAAIDGALDVASDAVLGDWWRDVSFAFVYYLIVLIASLVGACYGRRHHDRFLAKKLARLERKAAKDATNEHESTLESQVTETNVSAQETHTAQGRADDVVSIVGQPNDPPPRPDAHPTRDPFEAIEKLAHLRETGALTEEEFQAKKTEILARI